jgi:hypothetical protein
MLHLLVLRREVVFFERAPLVKIVFKFIIVEVWPEKLVMDLLKRAIPVEDGRKGAVASHSQRLYKVLFHLEALVRVHKVVFLTQVVGVVAYCRGLPC